MFTYKLNAKQYRLACRYRTKKNGFAPPPGSTSFFAAAVVLVFAVMVKAGLFFFVLPLVLAGFGIYEVCSFSMQCIRAYEKYPFLYGTQKCTFDEKGVTVQNSFEKIFSTYGDIYFAKKTKKYLLVLPTFGAGVIFLNKKEHAKEAQELEAALKKGGVKL